MNSIMTVNAQNEFILEQMKDIIQNEDNCDQMKLKMTDIINELKQGNDIQHSSGKLISFMLQDLLDYSQINQNKFRENIEEFDIRKCVTEVIDI